MKFNAVLKNEKLRINRTYMIPLSVFLANILMAVIVFTYFFNVNNTAAIKNRINYSNILQVINYIVYVQMFLIASLVTYMAHGSINNEKEGGGLFVIFLSGIKSFELVFGKMLAYLSSIFVVVFSTLPIYFTTQIFGGFDILNTLSYILYLACNSLFIINLCMFISSLTSEFNSAQIVCFLMSLLFESFMAVFYLNVLKSSGDILIAVNAALFIASTILFLTTSKILSIYNLNKES